MRLFFISFFLFTSAVIKAQVETPNVLVKNTDERIVLDGEITEQAWKDADDSGLFWQQFPSDSIPGIAQTRFKAVVSGTNLYVLIQAFSSSPEYIVPSLKRDFRGFGNDNITFMLDTFSDGTNAFLFGTNPSGVQREALISNGGNNFRTDFNESWDMKWQLEVKIHEDGYVAEIRIPLSNINFPAGSQSWRFNLYRYNTKTAEWTSWAKIPQNQSLISLAFMGTLTFEQPLGKSKAPLAFIPFVNGITATDFENDEKTNNLTFGGDAKIPIGNGMNLDVTVNPDFSQVEVDDQVVNLTRFELSLPEKRQFFIQNSDLFSNYGNSRDARPFFSRRIGVAKDLDGNNIENKIIVGTRLSGKINDDWRLGFLNMLTDEDVGNEIPSNNNTVLALQKKVFNRSNISMLMINRQTVKDYEFVDSTETYNRLAGIDYNLASKDNSWTGRAFVHKTFTPHAGRDDMSAGLILNRNTRTTGYRLGGVYVGDDFQSDLGFVRRKGIFKIIPGYTYKIYPQNKKVNRWELSQNVFMIFRPSEDFTISDRTYLTEVSIQYQNQSNLEFQLFSRYTYLYDAFDPTGIHDDNPLPAETGYRYTSFDINFRTDPTKQWTFDFQPSVGQFYNGVKYSFRSNTNLRLQPYLNTSLILNYDRIALADPYPKANLWLVSPKIDVTFSKQLFWTTYIQFSSQSENLGINSRLQWRFAPLSDIFVVYNDNYQIDNSLMPRFRSFNIKLTYWLNI